MTRHNPEETSSFSLLDLLKPDSSIKQIARDTVKSIVDDNVPTVRELVRNVVDDNIPRVIEKVKSNYKELRNENREHGYIMFGILVGVLLLIHFVWFREPKSNRRRRYGR